MMPLLKMQDILDDVKKYTKIFNAIGGRLEHCCLKKIKLISAFSVSISE